MPLPTRTPSTRIPASSTQSSASAAAAATAAATRPTAASRRDGSPTKSTQPPSSFRLASARPVAPLNLGSSGGASTAAPGLQRRNSNKSSTGGPRSQPPTPRTAGLPLSSNSSGSRRGSIDHGNVSQQQPQTQQQPRVTPSTRASRSSRDVDNDDNSNSSRAGALTRARSLRKPAAPSGPPTSFKMPLRSAQRNATSETSNQGERAGTSSGSTGVAQRSNSLTRSQSSSSNAQAPQRSNSLARSQSNKTRRSSSFNDHDSTPTFQTPRAISRTRPPSSSQQYGKRPTSASSVSTPNQFSSPRKLELSARQQKFGTPSKASGVTNESAGLTAQQMRLQIHLLHMSILHEKAEPSLAAYTASAFDKLAVMHENVQDLYVTSLQLSRSVRQRQNLLTLMRWTDGNIAVLERKLSALCAVLDEISQLTVPVIFAGEADAVQFLEPEEAGPYSQLVEQFTTWVSYVLGVWEARDAAASTTTRTERLATPPGRDDDDDYTPIEGLGDGTKASIRQLADTVNALLIRLEDVRSAPIPALEAAQEAASENDKDQHAAKSSLPTPAILASYACTMLDSMAEELQLMREIEFEVVIGEKAWVEDRMRRLRPEEETFATPKAFRDVF